MREPEHAVVRVRGERRRCALASRDLLAQQGVDVPVEPAPAGRCRSSGGDACEVDGLLEGPDLDLLRRLVATNHGRIIASGGIASIADVIAVQAAGCIGAIVGRALYEGRVDLRELARAVAGLYGADPAFREAVNRYIHDFEAMLRAILAQPDGTALAVTLLSSDMGKLYAALAQIDRRR